MKSATPASKSTSVARPHRCFRTTADGRIPLVGCWPALFDACASWHDVALQTRHAYARLVHRGALPRIDWTGSGAPALAASVDGTLALHLGSWSRAQAWGRLALCACCGSPGRIELHHPTAGEFLHLSAPADLPAADWSHAIAPLVAETPGLDDAFQPSSSPPPTVRIPSPSRTLCRGGDRLAVFLSALGDEDTPITCQLRTGECTHTRRFIPLRVFVEDGVLSIGDTRSTFQVALPFIGVLAITYAAGTCTLHVGSAYDELLVSFSAGPKPKDAASWYEALAATFPLFR